MAVSVAKELPDSPDGDITTSGGETKANFTRKFIVDTTTLDDGPIAVLNAVGIPRPWHTYAFGSEAHIARVVDRSAKRLAPNSLLWEITVKYESPDKDEDDFENPLAEPPVINLTFENTQEIVKSAVDAAGAPAAGLANSAGELFNPPPMRDVARPVLTITRNEDIASPIVATSVEYVNATNSDTFWGAGAGVARVMGISVDREQKEIDDDGTLFAYLKVQYKIVFSAEPDGWKLVLLDHGTYYLDDEGKKIEFLTEDGHPRIGLLDTLGKEAEEPHFLDPINIYKSKSFAALNLPTSF